jgi:HlyD family secretion protein
MSRRKLFLLAALALTAVPASGVLLTDLFRQPQAGGRAAGPAPGPVRTVALGRVEPEDGVLSLGVPLPDRVADVLAREGAWVEEGAPLLRLESAAARQAELDLARAQLAEARKRLGAIRAGGLAQLEVERLRRDLARARSERPTDEQIQAERNDVLAAAAEHARAARKRIYSLADSVASPQQREQQDLAVRQTEADLAAGEAALEKLKKTLPLEQRLADAQVRAAETALERAAQEIPLESLARQVAAAEERLRQAVLRAPAKGRVLKVLARKGELVGAQPVLQMADTGRMAVVAEVYETDVAAVRAGQKARVTSRALGERPREGVVVSKGSQVARNRVFDADPTAGVDSRVVEVRVRVGDDPELAGLIGHQVRVEIDTAAAPAAR